MSQSKIKTKTILNPIDSFKVTYDDEDDEVIINLLFFAPWHLPGQNKTSKWTNTQGERKEPKQTKQNLLKT